MATNKYVSVGNLSNFLDNLKSLFATKTEISAKADKTHTHTIANVSGLQSALDDKASTSHGTHVTYSATAPLMDGTASVGTTSAVSRSDHRHPTDTSRAAQTSLDSHTNNTTAHITSSERANWGTGYSHSQSAHAPSNAEKNQNAFSYVKVGDTSVAADSTTDTITLVAGTNVTITPDATNDKITISAKDTTYSLSSFGITATAAELNKLDGVTATVTEINYVDGVTSNIQTQLDNKAAKSHTHTVANISDLTATAKELNYMDGVTSNVQTQLDGKAASGHTHNYAGSSSVGGAATSANKLNTNDGSATQPVYFKNGVPVATTHTLGKSVPSNAVFTDTHYSSKNVVGATNATSNTATALTNGNVYINSVENGAVTSSHKISGSGATTVTTDTNGNIVISSTDNNTTYSAAGSALGLVKSGGDVTISSGVITVNDDSHNHTIANVDNLQSSLDAKQATVTGGASTITSSNLTTSRALVSDSSGKVAVSAVTSTELGYLDGVTSNIQTQLDGKAASSHNHAASNIVSGTLSSDRLPTVPIAKGGTGATTAAAALTNLGITATASELNYVDGVTSNIQSQLNNKAASSHTHSYLPLSGGNLTGVLGIGNKYELSPAYNFTNGCLINICAAKSSTMVAIHITGNSYNSSTAPIDSLFQFYDYGDGTIMNYSGVNLGLSLGAMTAYRYNGRLYAHIKQKADYQTLSFTIITNKSGLTPTIENAAAHTSGYTDLATITPTNVSMSGHTHNYAGSSSAGGTANSAVKATQDASGNVIASTYATKTELDTTKTSLQTSINGKANSSHTHTIANITNLQTTLDGKSSTSHTHNYAGSSSVGGSATSAVKLDTSTAGDSNTPVYFSGGKPVACTALDLNTSGSSASCTGNSATATKLQTARTIGIGTGATGTATSFNGTGNITIPITDVKESYLSWGGKNLVGSVSPIGVALSTEHSANRIAYLNPAAIKVEYSNDAGYTWADSGLANSAKINFVTTSNAISVGSNSTVTTNHRTRVTLTAQDGTNGYVYTRPRKMLINVSTAGHGLTVTIEAKTGASGASWTTLGTYELNGWSGWNDIPMGISTFGGGTNQTGNYWYIRLTFANTSVNSSYTTTKSSIISLRLFGDTCWTRTSNMGETGHLYSYDSSQNATFPASVTAPTFSGSGVATVSEVQTYLGI